MSFSDIIRNNRRSGGSNSNSGGKGREGCRGFDYDPCAGPVRLFMNRPPTKKALYLTPKGEAIPAPAPLATSVIHQSTRASQRHPGPSINGHQSITATVKHIPMCLPLHSSYFVQGIATTTAVAITVDHNKASATRFAIIVIFNDISRFLDLHFLFFLDFFSKFLAFLGHNDLIKNDQKFGGRDGNFRGQGRVFRPGLTRCFLNHGAFQRSALCRYHGDSFITRLDDLSMNYCSQYNCSFRTSPENLLKALSETTATKLNTSAAHVPKKTTLFVVNLGPTCSEKEHPVKAFGWVATIPAGELAPFKFSRRATTEKKANSRQMYLVAENRVLKINPLDIGTSDSVAEIFFGPELGEIIEQSVSPLSSSVLINVKNRGLFAYRFNGQLLWNADRILYQSSYCEGCRKNVTDCYLTSFPIIDQCEAGMYISNTEGELYALYVGSPHFKWIQDFNSFDKIFTITPGNNGPLYLTIPVKALVLALDVSTGTIPWQRNIGPLTTTDCTPVVFQLVH
ncbi:hypothetical protein F0562_010436 [Nyssa sinensis]|uniref:Uncharacterized protein n=1 Tax=Nyssa sinensis TaxID=561372 RepID=A0A5J4ZZ91_9ASTE|nr:hypothetical protein F0562_010436 [Nyssa sinensis]